MFCPNCGAKNENSKFCVECGALLEENKQPVEKKANGSKKNGVVIGIVIVLVLLIIGGAVFFFMKKKDTSEKEEPVQSEQMEETEESKEIKDKEETTEPEPIAEAEEPVEEPAEEPMDSMPEELLGVWKAVKKEHRGESVYVNELMFFPKGNIICDGEYSSCSAKGNEIVIQAIQNVEGADFKWTYAIEDITDTEDTYHQEGEGREHFEEYDKPFYEKYQNDKMTLQITGTVQESPTSKLEVDSTIVYEKEFGSVDDWLEYFMLGNWKDNNGNNWSFSMTDNGLEYQLADKDGNTYEGDFIYVSEKTPEAIFVVDFNFDDINVSVEGELTELSANKLVLNSEGESFVLTRTDEGGMKPFSEILPWESWNLEN